MSSKNLTEICKLYDDLTDKDTVHSYVTHAYSTLFDNHLANNASKILEIGVQKGGSLLLWRDFFSNATIYGIDTNISHCSQITDDRIKILNRDAYNEDCVNSLPNDFDIIIDDGPHTLNSMIFCVEYYVKKLNNNGLLIIEDLQDISWVQKLTKHIDPFLAKNINIVDLRSIKNRYDDILFIIDKRIK